MQYNDVIPEKLWPLLDSLERLDSIKREEFYRYYEYNQERRKKFSGKELLENAIKSEILNYNHDRHLGKYYSNSIDVIPGKEGRGYCCEILLVFIGDTDNFENRILETLEHCGIKCRGRTRYVIFYATQWRSRIWEEHRYSFDKLVEEDRFFCVVKKMFGEKPIRLI